MKILTALLYTTKLRKHLAGGDRLKGTRMTGILIFDVFLEKQREPQRSTCGDASRPE
jgi:hypothetical protein